MPPVNQPAQKANTKLPGSVWSIPHFRLGVIGIFFYVGVEVAVGSNINLYATSLGTELALAATKMASLYWTGILIGRFIGSFFRNVSAQIQLIICAIGAVALLLITMVTGNPWILVGVGLFHSVMWPAIYTLAMDKLGVYESKGSGVLMIGVVGGGVIPFIQGILADAMHGDWRWTWFFIILGELYILYYGISGYKIKRPVLTNR